MVTLCNCPGQSERMAEALLRTEMNLRRNLESLDGEEAASGGQYSPEPELLRGKQMILSEGEEKAARFKKWLAQMREVKARLSLAIEGSNKELADKEGFADADKSAATLRDKIKQWEEEASEKMKKCNKAYSEAIIMVECYDCELSGEQWSKQTHYVTELKEEWAKEQERSGRHMDHLAEAEKRLA